MDSKKITLVNVMNCLDVVYVFYQVILLRALCVSSSLGYLTTVYAVPVCIWYY